MLMHEPQEQIQGVVVMGNVLARSLHKYIYGWNLDMYCIWYGAHTRMKPDSCMSSQASNHPCAGNQSPRRFPHVVINRDCFELGAS
jgi:hypothetical protein